jgi:hypothetical protein
MGSCAESGDLGLHELGEGGEEDLAESILWEKLWKVAGGIESG